MINRGKILFLISYLLVFPYLCLFVLLAWLRCWSSTRGRRIKGALGTYLAKRRLSMGRRVTRCNLCDSTGLVEVYEVIGLGGMLYPIFQCRSCGLVFLGRRYSDNPGNGDVRLWAETDLGIQDGGKKDIDLFLAYNRMREEPFRNYSRVIRERIAAGKILDLGCANGYFLSFFPSDRWERYGVEFNQDNFRECERSGLNQVFLGGFSQFQAPPGSFNVISMIEFIEHCVDPLGDLRKCRRLLRADGVLFIVTGNIESEKARRAGLEWSYLTAAPEHRYFFSGRTLCRMVKEAGFREAEFVLGDDKGEVVNVLAVK